jgi:5-methylcytosine-specific restriction enzyme A
MSRKQTGFSPDTKAAIFERADGRCEICAEWFSDMQYHHRRPRGMGGTRREDSNTASAGLYLCAEDHRIVEAYRVKAFDNGWLVRQSQTPTDIPVLRRGVWVELRDSGAIIPVTTPPVSLQVVSK